MTPPRRVGLDNSGLFPLALSPLDTAKWAHAHGADRVAFSGLTEEQQAHIDPGTLTDLRMFAAVHHPSPWVTPSPPPLRAPWLLVRGQGRPGGAGSVNGRDMVCVRTGRTGRCEYTH